jgi:DNA (cytosine-5)-methyltransferase 1
MRPGEIIVDSFAGGGGASLGISWALGRGPDIAINHDKEAIALHAANHPESVHYAEDVWKVDPVVACAGRPVGLMWLSPDCKHFSKAKGGKPVSKRVRGLAWIAVRWAEAVKPRIIVLENVEEFQTWGPVLADGRPCPQRKGKTFRAFRAKLQRLGYVVDHRELKACDYGTPTIRKRLFLVARCDGEQIVWPAPTHGKNRASPWRTAAECIDWSIPCPSIFERTRPLAENTLKRIARGLRRFVLESPKPFIVEVQNASWGGKPISIDEPMRTVTAHPKGGGHAIVMPVIEGLDEAKSVCTHCGFAMWAEHDRCPRCLKAPDPTLVAPIIAPLTHHDKERGHPANEPVRTITGANRGEHALIAPVLAGLYGDKGAVSSAGRCNDFRSPLPTQTADPRFALVAPTLVPRYGEREGQEPRARSLRDPVPTVVPTGNGGSLCAAFLAKHYTERNAGDVNAAAADAPLPTITARATQLNIATAHLEVMHGTSGGRSVEQPAPTVLANGLHLAEVRAFLVAYYGNEKDGGDLHDPMRTLSTRDRFGLVTVNGVEYAIADIGMRMLAPRELYRAQGFPDTYRIDIDFNGKPMTKTAQVRMCGNSVCPPLAEAIVRANVLGGVEVERDLFSQAVA